MISAARAAAFPRETVSSVPISREQLRVKLGRFFGQRFGKALRRSRPPGEAVR